jgi:hypothetical protein
MPLRLNIIGVACLNQMGFAASTIATVAGWVDELVLNVVIP